MTEVYDWDEIWKHMAEELQDYSADVRTSPLFELLSVSLHRNTIPQLHHGSHDLKVYGHVRLIDYDAQNVFTLFQRRPSNPHSVFLPNGENVSVILNKSQLGSPHMLPKSFTLDIVLKDADRHLCLIKSERVIDFQSLILYDKPVYVDIPATRERTGDFRVGCMVLQCAVIASVDFLVRRKEADIDETESYAYVSGTISATIEAGNDSYECAIFDVPAVSKFGDPVERSQLAVPAYASLIIHANLLVNGERIGSNDPWKCEAEEFTSTPKLKEISGHKYCVVLRCSWEPFLEKGFPKWNHIEGASSEEDEVAGWGEHKFEEWKDISDNPQKKKLHRMTLRKQIKSGASYNEQPPRTLRKRYKNIKYARELVELFSISVFRYDRDDAVSLHGTIKSYDVFGEFMIFDRDMSKPEIVYPFETVPLRDIKTCYEGPFYGIQLVLKDEEGVYICRGDVSECDPTIQYDRRMCSIVKGPRGFACVHYTVFSKALPARVRVIFKSESGCGSYQVCGSIFARYSGYKYESHYELCYYQSKLFDVVSRNKDSVNLKDGDEIPLSKSMVAVPLNASLIVDVNLDVGIECGTTPEAVKVSGKDKFKAEMIERDFFRNYNEPEFKNRKFESNFRTIGDGNGRCQVQVCVEWV